MYKMRLDVAHLLARDDFGICILPQKQLVI